MSKSAVVEECAPASLQKPTPVIARPQLRGLLATATKKHAVACFAIAIGACMYYRFKVGEPRKQRYADFYRTYDSHADMKRMVKAGVFPDYTIEEFEEYEQALLKKLQDKKRA